MYGKHILLILPFVLNSIAFGTGATSSGGGNGFSNRENPWFLENTTRVPYCVEIDEQAMGITEERAIESIEKALKFWQMSFEEAFTSRYNSEDLEPYGEVRVATQSFERLPCNSSTMLRFQLGTLTPSQIALLGIDHDLIGLAMRTSYDNTNMQGSGFIFVTPQSGPLKTKSRGFSENAWTACNGCLLDLVMRHEIGHIFGVQHSGEDEYWNIMRQANPAILSSESLVGQVSEIGSFGQFLSGLFSKKQFSSKPNDRLFEASVKNTNAGLLFQMEPEERVIRIAKNLGQPPKTFETIGLYAINSKSGKERYLGVSCGEYHSTVKGTSFQNVFLPVGQRVFKTWPIEEGAIDYLLPSSYRKVNKILISGRLCLHSSTLEIPFSLEIVQGQGQLNIVTDGKINADFLTDDWRPKQFLTDETINLK